MSPVLCLIRRLCRWGEADTADSAAAHLLARTLIIARSGSGVPAASPAGQVKAPRLSSSATKPEGRHVFLFAFDLLELDGEDLRRATFETRKATLASLLRRSRCAPERAPDASRRRQTSTGRHGHHVRTLKDTRINETGIVH